MERIKLPETIEIVYTPNGVNDAGSFAKADLGCLNRFTGPWTNCSPLHPHMSLPEKHLLRLHTACNSRELWNACRKLLDHCFESHFLAIGFSFQGNSPMVIKRTKPAPERDADWWARNAAMHPLTPKLLEEPFPKIMRVSDQMTLEEIKNSEYYKEFVADENWIYSVGVFIRDGARVIGMAAVNRREDQGDFTAEEMEVFNQLYPHLEVAFQRVARIQKNSSASQSMATMLGRLPVAVAILDWNGEVTYINDAARQACLDWEYGERSETRSMGLPEASIPEIVTEACVDFARSHDWASTLNSPANLSRIELAHPMMESWRIAIEPLAPRSEPLTKPAFLVQFNVACSTQIPESVRLQLLSVLTTAEKAVAELLVQGLTNREIATKLGKSEATVKKQAESIYRKLGMSDRRQLMLALRAVGAE